MFKFKMLDLVKISVSAEQGTIVGRAEYKDGENRYYIRYQKADGCATEQWWDETAIQLIV